MNNLNVNAIINAALNKDCELNAALLLSLVDSDVNTYDILEVLCEYINALDLNLKHKDAGYMLKLKTENKRLKERLLLLNENYQKALSEHLETKQHLLNVQNENSNLTIKLYERKAQIEELQLEIRRMELLR